ncbi:dihydrofolate reductase [Persicitalea jodogahamensis]|uniref:Dihydrofolate reductase n=1 Tax=Persicitalea jodogahamensis TaxID=402147 RepID=A0A8J3GAD3_9BACT|nr:dihydrofolate reductase [Persicitalea jodogahamensis]GHB71989.1 dihydrofolate reductase [Persicitalea jodogahamensis]
MKISLIVAAAENGVIGKENQLLWRLPDDLKRFKQLTLGHPIIMGRKTYESIGKPLPGRTSIVITRSPSYKAEGVLVVNSLELAIETARRQESEEAFVIGGGEIYREALGKNLAEKIYLTRVLANVDGDTFFKIPDEDDWTVESHTERVADERHEYAFQFVDLTRKGTL